VAAQRSAQRKAFAAFVGKFFIPFPGTKISGEYTGAPSGGERGQSRRFSSAVKISVLTPNPVRAHGGPFVRLAGSGEPAPARPEWCGAVSDGSAAAVGGEGAIRRAERRLGVRGGRVKIWFTRWWPPSCRDVAAPDWPGRRCDNRYVPARGLAGRVSARNSPRHVAQP